MLGLDGGWHILKATLVWTRREDGPTLRSPSALGGFGAGPAGPLGDPGGAGGGATANADPCAGKKNPLKLNYFTPTSYPVSTTAIQHILRNHVIPGLVSGKSKYKLEGSNNPVDTFEAVLIYNAATFLLGTPTDQGKTVKYEFAVLV